MERSQERPRRRVFVVVGHELSVHTLWLLARIASHPGVDLLTLVPQRSDRTAEGSWSSLPKKLLTAKFREKQQRLLQELFDAEAVGRWWREGATVMTGFPSLDHPHAIPGIAALGADAIVSFRGNGLAARLADRLNRRLLAVRIGERAVEDAMEAVMLGIVQERPRLLEATIHSVEPGQRQERRLWCAAPQIAPGDTGEAILLRLAAELADALLVQICRESTTTSHPQEVIPEVVPADLVSWLRYIWIARGRRSRYVYERAIKC